MIQRLLIPRIIIDINRDRFKRRYFPGEGVQEGVVLPIPGLSALVLSCLLFRFIRFASTGCVCSVLVLVVGGDIDRIDMGMRTVRARRLRPFCWFCGMVWFDGSGNGF